MTERIWLSRYNVLTRYVDEYHSLPICSSICQGINIVRWCSRQRVQYKGGTLSTIRIIKLENIDEWAWTVALSAEQMCKRTTWTPEYFDEITKRLLNEYSYIPSGRLLLKIGLRSYTKYMYANGMTMESLQKKYNCRKHRWISKNDMFWMSMPECCLANFLYARGVGIKNGERYPPGYSTQSGKHHGIYDLHFVANLNEYENKWISVEVWGDNPGGHGAEEYKHTREGKELFNINNNMFLGIGYKSCYVERELEIILSPYIGIIAPYIFEDQRYAIFKTTQWSTLDVVIKKCEYIMKYNNNIIPPCGWFVQNKGTMYENRIHLAWEKGINISLSTLLNHITKCGGIVKIRKLLNAQT